MTAGALNIGTGMLRGIGDSIVDANDKSKIRKMKEYLFENEEIKTALIEGMEQCMWGVFYALIDLLSELFNKNLFKYDTQRSEAIFENVVKHVNDRNELIDGLVQSISLYPYHEEYYMFLIDKFNDPQNEIEKTADFFGININAYKRTKIEKYMKELNFSNEKETIESKRKLTQYVKNICFNDSEEYTKEIDNKLMEFDRQAKQYNGIIYETRELANLACEEDNFGKKVLEELNEKDKTSLITARDKIKGRQFQTDVYKPYLDTIEGFIEKKDVEDRTVEGVLYETLEKADLARNDIELMNRIFRNTNKKDNNSLLEAKNKISAAQLNIVSKEKYINKINSLIVKLDTNNRTVGGIVFDDIEIANVAKAELHEINEILKEVDENDEKMVKIALNKIKALNCRTSIKEKIIDDLTQRITDRNSKLRDLKKDLSKHNGKLLMSIIIAIIALIIGIPVFFSVGLILKIIIGILLLAALGNIIEVNDNRKGIKEELTRMKKNR